MNLVRGTITVLVLAIVVVSFLGILWWRTPPEALAGYSRGGQVVLAVLCVSGLLGIWRLWTPTRTSS